MTARYRLAGVSPSPADRLIPRFDLFIPAEPGCIEAELTEEQAEWLEADPVVHITRIAEPEAEPATPRRRRRG